MSKIDYVQNKMKTAAPSEYISLFGAETQAKTVTFHRSMGSKYTVTPLRHLKSLSNLLGLKDIFLKDESQRHPLKAFKLLGGSYAVANFLCSQLGIDISDTSFEELKSNSFSFTFVAASDGNHGKSVAWSAHEFGQGCIIYMPKGTVRDRVSAIEQFGATAVSILSANYAKRTNPISPYPTQVRA
jgi:diaminopropionate ammonia-lyase